MDYIKIPKLSDLVVEVEANGEDDFKVRNLIGQLKVREKRNESLLEQASSVGSNVSTVIDTMTTVNLRSVEEARSTAQTVYDGVKETIMSCEAYASNQNIGDILGRLKRRIYREYLDIQSFKRHIVTNDNHIALLEDHVESLKITVADEEMTPTIKRLMANIEEIDETIKVMKRCQDKDIRNHDKRQAIAASNIQHLMTSELSRINGPIADAHIRGITKRFADSI